MSPKSDERQKYIDDINKSDESLFEKTAGEDRIFPSIIILIVNIVKMAILFLISLLQIAFQLFTILLVFGFPFILLMSIVPFFGGAGLVESTLKQIVSTQIGIVLTSLLLGIIIEIDALVGDMFKSQHQYGWFFASFFQSAIFGAIIWQRKQIFGLLASIQRKFSTAGVGVWHRARRSADKMVTKGGERMEGAKEGIYDKASNLREWANDKIGKSAFYAAYGVETAGDYIRNRRYNGTGPGTSSGTSTGTSTRSRRASGPQNMRPEDNQERRTVTLDSNELGNSGNISSEPSEKIMEGVPLNERAGENSRRTVTILDPGVNNYKKDIKDINGSKDKELQNKETPKMSLKDRMEASKKAKKEAEEIELNTITRSELEAARERMAKGESLDSIYSNKDGGTGRKLVVPEGQKNKNIQRQQVEITRNNNDEIIKQKDLRDRNFEAVKEKERGPLKEIKVNDTKEKSANNKSLNDRVREKAAGKEKGISQEERANMFSRKIRK